MGDFLSYTMIFFVVVQCIGCLCKEYRKKKTKTKIKCSNKVLYNFFKRKGKN